MLTIPVNHISRVMGLKKGVGDIEHLMEAIEQGLPKQALSAVLGYFSGHEAYKRNELLSKIVSLATFKRRKRLKPDEGEKVTRLARLIAYARFVWDGDELGAMKVERILTNILHGLPA